MSQYTLTIDDPDRRISDAVKADMQNAANYVIQLIDRYIDWKGVLDVEIEIRPNSELTWSPADGLLPTIGQLSLDGEGWNNDTLIEALTGVDKDTQRPDAGCTIYLGEDGTLRNYGAPVWIDPDPEFERDPNVPTGHHDFVGIFTHEVFHSLGFYGATNQWKELVEKTGNTYYFDGEKTSELLGQPLILAPWTATDGTAPDHYGNEQSSVVPRGLMYQWGNYAHNRLDIGRLDLAVLADLGYVIETYDGLALFEMQDDNANLAGSAATESLFGDYHANRLDAKGGDDTIRAGAGDDLIWGGSGFDQLWGEAGADTFVYGTVSDSVFKVGAFDILRDFDPTEGDRIDLAEIDANTRKAGNQKFKFDADGDGRAGTGQLSFRISDGQTYVYGNTDKDKKAEFHVVIDWELDISASDFIL